MEAVIKFLWPLWSSSENKGTFCFKMADVDKTQNHGCPTFYGKGPYR